MFEDTFREKYGDLNLTWALVDLWIFSSGLGVMSTAWMLIGLVGYPRRGNKTPYSSLDLSGKAIRKSGGKMKNE